jgi:hypothetical protein
MIKRYGKGFEDDRHPAPGWWLDVFADEDDGYAEEKELNFGPFETMQDAADFRDAKIQ